MTLQVSPVTICTANVGCLWGRAFGWYLFLVLAMQKNWGKDCGIFAFKLALCLPVCLPLMESPC